MTLTTPVEHDGTEFEIDLDALDRFGDYFVDDERGLIINAAVYTHGTPDSRHVRGDVVCGTDYTFEPINVDRETVREHIRDEYNVEIAAETLDHAIEEYQATGLEVIESFDESLERHRILSKATSGVISTDIREPLIGWESTFDDLIVQIEEQQAQPDRQEIVRELFNALRTASPGKHEYSAQIKLVNATHHSTD